MEIQVLRLRLTDQDLTELARRHALVGQPVRNFAVRVTPDGVCLLGTYDAGLLGVPFESHWRPEVQGGRLVVRLLRLQTGDKLSHFALGLVNRLRPGAVHATLMEQIARAVAGEDSIRVEGEAVVVDVERLAARQGLSLRVNLTAVHCEVGRVIVESAAP